MSLFLQIILTLLAAFFGAWFTLQRFRIERWWEKKANAYIELIEALHDMGLPPSEYFGAGVDGREVAPEREKELWENYHQAERRVWKIADSADFIISADVFDAIQRMLNGLSEARDAQDWYQHLDETQIAVDRCLEEVKQIGSEELGIRKGKDWNRWVPVGYLYRKVRERFSGPK
ncbi:hypothetical protein FMN52_13755 [Marinobacter sp. BW6]|uniref:hypothetical protein n=1 Tax=Marinobacter sp. BW6 TaxID=2592624 RepID=UPI0011DED77B|nr:hypothetical protein [Marinobacter sp. BW6]TYC57613.1 hypothetical protein FMN52_13755 [Marinobacter sp. BW6]